MKILEDNIDIVHSQKGLQDYIRMRKPVKIPFLFKDRIVSKIPDFKSFVDVYGDVEIPISREYTDVSFVSQKPNYKEKDKVIQISEYYQWIVGNKEKLPWYCVELLTPEVFSNIVPFHDCDFISECDNKDSLSFFFFGNKGNKSNLHFDGDFRSVFLTQILGTKRIILISPEETSKLLPMKNFSGLMMDRMSDNELDEFLQYTKAIICEISAGETIYMPSCWWHHVDYVTDAVSINYRIPRNEIEKFLGSGKIHISYKTQLLVNKFREQNLHEEALTLKKEISGIMNTNQSTAIEKWQLIEAKLDDYISLYCSDFSELPLEYLHNVSPWHFWEHSLSSGRLYPAVANDG